MPHWCASHELWHSIVLHHLNYGGSRQIAFRGPHSQNQYKINRALKAKSVLGRTPSEDGSWVENVETVHNYSSILWASRGCSVSMSATEVLVYHTGQLYRQVSRLLAEGKFYWL